MRYKLTFPNTPALDYPNTYPGDPISFKEIVYPPVGDKSLICVPGITSDEADTFLQALIPRAEDNERLYLSDSFILSHSAIRELGVVRDTYVREVLKIKDEWISAGEPTGPSAKPFAERAIAARELFKKQARESSRIPTIVYEVRDMVKGGSTPKKITEAMKAGDYVSVVKSASTPNLKPSPYFTNIALKTARRIERAMRKGAPVLIALDVLEGVYDLFTAKTDAEIMKGISRLGSGALGYFCFYATLSGPWAPITMAIACLAVPAVGIYLDFQSDKSQSPETGLPWVPGKMLASLHYSRIV